MPSSFRVRFAPPPPQITLQPEHHHPRPVDELDQRKRSRSGCKDCKRRRVKCDETFPVCLRCQKRGIICEADHQIPQWQQLLLPSLFASELTCASPIRLRLLQYWCERASHVMVLDPESNPFSFPILEHFESSPSLMPTILSISAAHEQFFRKDCLEYCLKERSIALSLLRNEIGDCCRPNPVTFLSIFLLGISSPWIDTTQCEFGFEHLHGAKALIDIIIESASSTNSSFLQFVIGTYLYWDMACSFLVEPGHQRASEFSSNSMPLLQAAIRGASGTFHPIMGYSAEMMHLLGDLGRYCRSVVEFGLRDLVLELKFEGQLLSWTPNSESHELTMLGNAFKHHGLINLYRICGHPLDHIISKDANLGEKDQAPACISEAEGIILQYALKTVRDLNEIPTSNWHTNMQAICLLTAGSELRAKDEQERRFVIARFNALYSINRIPGNLRAVEILKQLWEARDLGFSISWVHVMLCRGWRLSLG